MKIFVHPEYTHFAVAAETAEQAANLLTKYLGLHDSRSIHMADMREIPASESRVIAL